MSEFRATNDIPIRPMQDGGIDMHGFYITEREMQALREFFQAERDKELGRWRESPGSELVVYSEGVFPYRIARVLDEHTGEPGVYYEMINYAKTGHSGVAQAYFKEHPARKPWHDAKQGEVWELTVALGHKIVVVVNGRGQFFSGEGTTWSIDTPMIKSATRIYPATEDS